MKQILSVGLIAVMVFSVYGCGGSNQESSKEGNSSVKSAKETTKSSKVKSSGKVTEDVYIDVLANQQVLTAKYMTGVETSAGIVKAQAKQATEMEKVLDKHGVTMDEVTEYAEKYEDSPETYMKIMQKLGTRMEELSKEYGIEE